MAAGGDSVQEFPIQHVVECEDCGEQGDIPWYCKNCPGSLCDKCKEAHQRAGILKKHSIVPRSSVVLRTYGPAKIAEICKAHPEKDISTYCNDCKVPCCASCLIEVHQRHSLSLIEEKYLSAETRLNDYIKVLETDVCGKLKDMRIRIEENISVGDKCSESVNKEIQTFEEEVMMVVHKSFQSLHKEVHGPRKDLTKDLADIDTQLKKVSEVIQQCEKKIRIGNLDIIQFIPPDSESFIPKLNISAQVVPRFLPNRDILENIKLQLGKIEYTSPVKRENDKEKGRVVSLQVTIVNTFKSLFECTAISTIGDNKAWIIYQSSTSMRLYDCTGKFLKSFSVEKGKSITYMAMKKTGEMVISCSDKTIRLISNTGDCTKLIKTDPLSPAGICVKDSGDVMVCMRGNSEHRHLAIYSDDMMLKKSAIKSQYFTDPYRLLEIENMLYIINYCKNVVCLNVQGIMKWEYNGAKDMQLKTCFSAKDISKDKYLNLLVVDCNNHCVHYINRDGQLIQIILTEGQTTLSYPWGISVDQETGLVWMGSYVRKDVCIASYVGSISE